MRWTLIALFLAHAVLGAALGLSVDEAHYALYAAHPALSYFDHPPLVGWLQWPLVALQLPDFVLRWVPGLVWLATMGVVARLARRLAGLQGLPGDAVATGALTVLLLAPLLHLLGLGLVPDTLLMFWSALIFLQTLALLDTRTAAQWRPWCFLGLTLGLAGLSKYTAIFTAGAVAVCLLQAHGWRLFCAARVWLALLIALLCVSPVLLWNAQNHWISFAYQASHGAGGGWRTLHLLRFLLLQVLAYGPLLLCGLAGALAVWQSRSVARWSGIFFALPFAILAAMSGGGSSLPHWTAPAWVALAPFAGLALARRSGTHGTPLWTGWRRGLVVFQALTCLVVPALLLTAGMPWMEGKVASAASSDPPNPFADVHGWDAAGARARALAQAQGVQAVAVQNWTLASRLGWYARPLPVFDLEDRFDQFTLWAGQLPAGGAVLLVDWSQMSYVPPVSTTPGAPGFARCDPLERLPVRRLGYALAYFDFYRCSGWSGKAQPQLRPAPLAEARP